MELIYGILGAVVISFILSTFRSILSLGRKKDEHSSNFLQKFTGTLMVLLIIVIIGYIAELSGCSPEEEPNYPMKYSPN